MHVEVRALGWCCLQAPCTCRLMARPLLPQSNRAHSVYFSAPSTEKTSTAKFLGVFGTCHFTFSIEMFSEGIPS